MFQNVQSKLAKQLTLNKTNTNGELTELKRELQTTKPKEKRNPSVGLRTLTSNNVKLPNIDKNNKNNTQNQKKSLINKDDSEDNTTSPKDFQIIRHVPNDNLLKEEQVLANIKKKLNKNGQNSQNIHNVQNVQNVNNYNTYNEENIYNKAGDDENIDSLMRENELLQQKLNEMNQFEANNCSIENNADNSLSNKENKPNNNIKSIKSRKGSV